MDASSYQWFRLWSGICSIGLNLGLIWAVYLASLLLTDLPGMASDWALPVYALGVAVLIILAFLPFEILIGHAAESAFSRSCQSWEDWLRDWSASQGLILAGLAGGICLFGYVGRLDLGSKVIALAVMAGLLPLFIYSLPFWMQKLAGLHATRNPELESDLNRELKSLGAYHLDLHILPDGDEEGVNGTILPFRPGIFYINSNAAAELRPKELAALALRELWFHRKGQSLLSTVIVVAWALAGLYLALRIPGFLLPASTALQQGLGGAALMTSWCFLALFVWPPFSNRIMLKADRFLAEKIGAQDTIALINKIQTLNESDFELPPAREHIFHPIPTLRKRIENLEKL